MCGMVAARATSLATMQLDQGSSQTLGPQVSLGNEHSTVILRFALALPLVTQDTSALPATFTLNSNATVSKLAPAIRINAVRV